MGPELPIERTGKTLIRLGGVFAGRTGHFVGFVVRRLIFYVHRTDKIKYSMMDSKAKKKIKTRLTRTC